MALDENGFVPRLFRLLFVAYAIQLDEIRQAGVIT
jgi:hypothetical protein